MNTFSTRGTRKDSAPLSEAGLSVPELDPSECALGSGERITGVEEAKLLEESIQQFGVEVLLF